MTLLKEKEITIAKMYVVLCDVLEHFACSYPTYRDKTGEESEKMLIERIENTLREAESRKGIL